MTQWQQGAEIERLAVTPDRYLTIRYAGASGDFNPIHTDAEFAQSVGLPGRILHGLWTMAQVARAVTDASGPAALESLQVQFRGVGVPEEELVISGTIADAQDGQVVVELNAEQCGRRIIRGGEARLRT